MNLVAQLAVALVPGVVIAIIAALVTVRLSVKQFRSERWWERKAEAYSTIVEALYKAKAYTEAKMSAYESYPELPKETELSEKAEERLTALSTEGWAEIDRATSIGAFVISDEAAECLRQLELDLDRARGPEDWWGMLCDHFTALEKCMGAMRKCAKHDLDVA